MSSAEPTPVRPTAAAAAAAAAPAAPGGWYATPHWYDIVFDTETRRDGGFLEAVFERHGRSRGRRVLEPACGSGRLVREMLRRGWSVTGFDASPSMLAYARRRTRAAARSPRLLEARMESFAVPGRFDLAHCLVNTFRYLLDERSAREHLRRVAGALAPGGLYVLGLHLSEYEHRRCTRERHAARRGDAEVVCNIQGWPADPRRRLERVRSRLTVRHGGQAAELETHWTFRTYDARQLARLLASVGALEHVATYDFDYDLAAAQPLHDDRLDRVVVLRRRAWPDLQARPGRERAARLGRRGGAR